MNGTVADLGQLFDGPHATPERQSLGDKYFLNISSLNGGRLDLELSDYVSDEDFNRWTRRVTPRAGDLLFSYETRLGDAALMPTGVRACLGRRMALLRPDVSVVDPRFLLYYWLSPTFQALIAERAIHGATVSRISLKALSSWPVNLPELEKQRAIGEVLGVLDDKIAANRRLVTVADHLIRSLVAATPRDEHPLWESLSITFGEAFRGARFSTPGVGRPLIRIRDLKSQKCQVWTTEERAKEHLVKPGYVLVGMDAEFRPTRWSGPVGVLNQRVLAVDSKEFGRAVSREIIRAPLARIEASKTATTVIHLNKADLMTEKVLAPTAEALAGLRSQVDPVYARATAAEHENVRLAATRDELLPLLMNGTITVKDAEDAVGEVI